VKRHGHGKVNSAKDLRKTIDRIYPGTFPIISALVKDEEKQNSCITIALNVSTLSASEEEIKAGELNTSYSQGASIISSSNSISSESRFKTEFSSISCENEKMSNCLLENPQKMVSVPNPLKQMNTPIPVFSMMHCSYYHHSHPHSCNFLS
jgi:hypothetical protein